jgi:ribose transport system substrate-binding protein
MVSWFGTPYLSATRYYSSAQTGIIAAQAVLNALAGKPNEFRTVIEQTLVTADNVEEVVAANPYMFMEYKDKVQNI